MPGHLKLVSRNRSTVGCFLMVAVFTTLLGDPGAASGYKTRARAAVLMEAGTGAVLYQHNADELLPPASMSKLMTLAVAFRALKKGRLNLDDEFVVSEHAWRTGGAPSRTASMFVPINTKASVRELIQGIIVQSGNDAAIAVAEGISGSEEVFAQRMTARARKIGMEKSVFKNATGLYDPQHLMTAGEIALLARYLITEFPEYYGMFAQREFRYRKHRFFNRNPLLLTETGVDGLKTGYVKDAGYGIVASAKQGNLRLVAVVMGLPSAATRKSEGRKLLEWGFRNVSVAKLFDANETVAYARVWGGDRYFAPLVGQGALSIYLPRMPVHPRLTAEIVYDSPLKAPISKGEKLAILRVASESGSMNELPLYAAADIEESGFMARGIDTLLVGIADWLDGQISALVGLAALDQGAAISASPTLTNGASASSSVQ
jgi:D-alanyl-D-alanine carboxypeptidase (penicillin-binding protein 5/6)